jgi:hypothetical protein
MVRVCRPTGCILSRTKKATWFLYQKHTCSRRQCRRRALNWDLAGISLSLSLSLSLLISPIHSGIVGCSSSAHQWRLLCGTLAVDPLPAACVGINLVPMPFALSSFCKFSPLLPAPRRSRLRPSVPSGRPRTQAQHRTRHG